MSYFKNSLSFRMSGLKKMSDVGLSAVKYTEILKLKKKLCARRQF